VAQHRRYEHRLRTSVRTHRGCLDALGDTTRRLLGLRAGLHGHAVSRGEAASRLGISTRRAARLEHAGLQTLRVACGVSAASAPPRVARLTNSAPTLEPASFLVPASSAPALRPAVELAKPRGSHGVESVSTTSRPPAEGGAPPVSAAISASLETGGSGPGLALILAICLGTLAVLALVAVRRGVVARERPAPAAAPAAAPAPSPPPEPVAAYRPPPPAPAEPPAPTRGAQVRRAATVAATSAVGFAVRELIRRRGGRRR
jgi:hypothetical protein